MLYNTEFSILDFASQKETQYLTVPHWYIIIACFILGNQV